MIAFTALTLPFALGRFPDGLPPGRVPRPTDYAIPVALPMT
jgi:hypothetical protein